MGRVTVRRRVLRIRDGVPSARPDTLAAEEPMEIRVGGRPLTVTMRTPGVAMPTASMERNLSTTSSCGLCGKAALDSVRMATRRSVADDPLSVPGAAGLPARKTPRGAEGVRQHRGGLRAAGLFMAGLFMADGALLCLREDVSRHNAVDKVDGHAFARTCCRCAGPC
ncbi:formate dehydrogenase accessory sulfurtransferase FdhD [Streptomyces sp. NPDC054783]